MSNDSRNVLPLPPLKQRQSENPWQTLPITAPYIAGVDNSYFQKYPKALLHLKTNVLPDAYLGNFENAKVVFLALNPGFQERDLSTYMIDKSYIEQNRASLLGKAEEFYVLNEKFNYSGGYKWWTRILKALIDEGISIEILRKKIMCIQYFPYHSTKYKHFSKKLPSQNYSFGLVRKAINQNKKIVMMRSERLWLEVVPELKGKYIKLRNFRNPVISKNNMHLEEFNEIKNLLSEI